MIAFAFRRSPVAYGAAAVLLATLSTLTGCDVAPPRSAEPVVVAGQTMGTTYEAKFFGVESDEAIALLSEAMEAELAEIDRQMSTYRPDSEISRFNAGDSTEWFEVSPGFEQVVRRALEISAESDGAFDPTVMPLVRLWRFGPDAKESSTVPSDAEIASAKAHVGYRLIETRSDPPAIRKTDPRAELDLNAVAPGYGVDRLGAILERAGATSWYVELGGEIRTSGAKPDGRPWIVGIETPHEGERSVETFVRLVGEALATSGDYRKFYLVDGARYSHTIDPTTGRPVLDPLASVSVLAKNCADADAYATAISALGEERGIRLAESAGLEVLLIVREKDSYRTRATPGFDERRLAP